MRNDTGIFNSRHFINEYKRDLQRTVIKAPAMFTIVSYADRIAGRYEAILFLIQGANNFDQRLADKGKRLADEYETQLTLLADYADQLAEAGIAS